MALSPKERERITEEETLRHEIRLGFHSKSSCHGRGRRWLWLAAFFLLGYAFRGLADRACHRFCPYEALGGMPGHCMMGMGSGTLPDSQNSGPGRAQRPQGQDSGKP